MYRGVWGTFAAASLLVAVVVPSTNRATAAPTHRVTERVTARAVGTGHAPVRLRAPGHDMVRRPGSAPSRRAAALSPPARVRLLAARVYVGSKPPSGPSTSSTKALLGHTATWFHTVSRGRESVSYRLTRWIRLPLSKNQMCGGEFEMVPGVKHAVSRAGYSLTGINRFMMLMPQCDASSLGEIHGPVTWIHEAKPTVSVLVHELGHNLGLEHAFAQICKADGHRVTYPGKCAGQEYGDLWDAMGISVRPYSVGVLRRLGWAGKVKTPSGSGTFTLADSEHSGHGIQGLRIRTGARRSYWVEYRTSTVSDPDISQIDGTPGVQIRLDTGAKSLRLLDALPGTQNSWLSFPDPDFVDVSLPVGASFTTPEKVRISVVSEGASSARVEVARGRAAHAPGVPGLAAAIDTGNAHDLYVDAPSDDGGQVVLGYLVTAHPSGRTTFLTDPAGTKPVLHQSSSLATSYDVQAVTQEGASSPSARVAVRTGGPVVSLTSPASGARIDGHRVQVSVAASPDPVIGSPVRSVTACLAYGTNDCYYRNRVEDLVAPYDLTLDEPNTGDFTLYVDVEDKQYNVTHLTRHVTVLGYPGSVTVTQPASGGTTGKDVRVVGSFTPSPVTGSPFQAVNIDLWSADGRQVAYTGSSAAQFDVTMPDVPAGTYTLFVSAYDAADESTVVSRTITVAPVRPQITISSPVPGATVSTDQMALVVQVDHPADLDRYASASVQVDGTAVGYASLGETTNNGYADVSGLPSGTHQLSLVIQDRYFGSWTVGPQPFTYAGP